jgi:DNA-binding transcriptional LysR family regulator
MELQQLRYLHAVVRTGSVTAAAAAEYVSQPSVSKQIRQLERELGVPLFYRAGRRLFPTEAGHALADMAERFFDDLASTKAQITDPGEGEGSFVRICATETVSDYLLPGALAAWQARFPRAAVSVEMLGSEAAVAEVIDGNADLAFVVLPIQDSRLEIGELLEEDVLLAVAPGHPWAARDTIGFDELMAEPRLLLSMRGIGLRSLVEAEASLRGIEPAGRIEMRSLHGMLAMVARGAGIALAPAMAFDGRTDVRRISIDPPLQRRVGSAHRKGRRLSPVTQALLDLVHAQATAS